MTLCNFSLSKSWPEPATHHLSELRSRGSCVVGRTPVTNSVLQQSFGHPDSGHGDLAAQGEGLSRGDKGQNWLSRLEGKMENVVFPNCHGRSSYLCFQGSWDRDVEHLSWAVQLLLREGQARSGARVGHFSCPTPCALLRVALYHRVPRAWWNVWVPSF